MLEEMDLSEEERAELTETRKIIRDGCKTTYAFDPHDLDPTKFRDLSKIGKIRFLKQAKKFLDLGIYVGG